MKIEQGDCLKLMKNLPGNSIDLIFTDPPYALGSEIIIRVDGKPDYKKAKDFMNKWEMPDAKFWEEWFFEAKRVLKYGGHCAMFGIDRQTFLFQYYAVLNGFLPKQSLYWYFISNFPKASDLSKNIDKRFGLERKVLISAENSPCYRKNRELHDLSARNKYTGDESITSPNHELAQKYKDLKYSVAPLKQTCEEIMVFQKPYKNKSCLDDVLAYENGDESITVGALDIENNRISAGLEITKRKSIAGGGKGDVQFSGLKTTIYNDSINGRYPSQTFVDSGTAERLDLQSGISKSDSVSGITNCKMGDSSAFGGNNDTKTRRNDIGGCSRILHKCDYGETDFDLFIYNPKVAKSERNEGLDGFEEKRYSYDGREKDIENPYQKNQSVAINNHPTLKPTKLLTHILKLFKTPNEQTILDPFMGSGSMGISAVNCKYNYIGYELDQEYFKIAEARINHAHVNKELQVI